MNIAGAQQRRQPASVFRLFSHYFNERYNVKIFARASSLHNRRRRCLIRRRKSPGAKHYKSLYCNGLRVQNTTWNNSKYDICYNEGATHMQCFKLSRQAAMRLYPVLPSSLRRSDAFMQNGPRALERVFYGLA